MKYNSLQWRESFEDQLSLLRPHLTNRLLASMSISAWIEHGTRDVDPVIAAKAWSAELDKAK